jgi:hypothetical protein
VEFRSCRSFLSLDCQLSPARPDFNPSHTTKKIQ